MALKRASRLPLFGILCLALILIGLAGLFIWLKGGGRTGAGDEEGGKAEEGKAEGGKAEEEKISPKERGLGKTRTRRPEGEGKDEKREEEKEMEDEKDEDDEEIMASEGGGGGEGQAGNAPICALGTWTVDEERECGEGNLEGGEREMETGEGIKPEEMKPEEWVRPTEYALNISLIESTEQPNFEMRLSILAQLTRHTDVIPLYCDTNVELAPKKVHVWHCPAASAGSPLCIRSSTLRLPARQLLLIHLARPLPSGSLVRVQFGRLRLPLSVPNPALFVQIPSAWERDRAWMVGSQLPLTGDLRHLIPSIPSARAVFRLCAFHSKHISIRSNSRQRPLPSPPSSSDSSAPPAPSVSSCFQATAPLPPAQFAFLFFRNLRSVDLPPPPPSSHSAPSSPLPPIELFIGSHLNPSDYEWAIEESGRTMRRMREMSGGIGYPMEKMTEFCWPSHSYYRIIACFLQILPFRLVSSPLSLDALGGLGLIQIRDNWMEYPKFVRTHQLLSGQLILQWTANVLGLCDRCLQRGFGIYLEWRVGAETAAEGAEFRRRFGEARQKVMAESGKAEGEAEGEAEGQGKEAQKCAERTALILHMLDGWAGAKGMDKFIRRLFRRYGWRGKCTPTEELGKLFAESSGGRPEEARRVFDSFLLPRPLRAPPLVHVRVLPDQSLLRFSQSAAAPPPSIPIEMVDDTRKSVRLVLNGTQTDIPFVVSSFALSRQSTFARFVYNVENYARLAKCKEGGNGGGTGSGREGEACPALQRAELQNAWDDMCWALFANKLAPPMDQPRLSPASAPSPPADPPRAWHSLFRTLSESNGTVRGDCACCMQRRERAMGGGHCRWIWMDKCARVGMLRAAEVEGTD